MIADPKAHAARRIGRFLKPVGVWFGFLPTFVRHEGIAKLWKFPAAATRVTSMYLNGRANLEETELDAARRRLQ